MAISKKTKDRAGKAKETAVKEEAVDVSENIQGPDVTKPPAVKEEDAVETGEAVALREASKTSTGGSFRAFLDAAEADGNTGLTIDRTSFPVVILDKTAFCDGTTKQELEIDGHALAHGFCFNPMTWNTRTIITITPEGVSKDDSEFYVVTGEDTLHTGESLSEKVAMAEQDGAEVHYKDYVEYVGAIYALEDEKGEDPIGLVMLQIPPMSKGKPAGAAMTYMARKRVTIQGLQELILKVTVGKKIIKGDQTYYPWAFQGVSVIEG